MAQLEEVYEQYFKDVYLFSYSLCGDRHIAEDITSEAFFKALKSIDQFQGRSDIRTWLFQIAKNTYFSYLRRKNRTVPMETLPEPENDYSLEERVSLMESSKEVHKILHDLKEPYKEVFSLRVFAELSFRQIGSLFGKSENWACVTYHRARKIIQERMEGKE